MRGDNQIIGEMYLSEASHNISLGSTPIRVNTISLSDVRVFQNVVDPGGGLKPSKIPEYWRGRLSLTLDSSPQNTEVVYFKDNESFLEGLDDVPGDLIKQTREFMDANRRVLPDLGFSAWVNPRDTGFYLRFLLGFYPGLANRVARQLVMGGD